MCGIVGIFNYDKQEIQPGILTSLNNTLAHRGPDYGSIKTFGNTGLGHRRLSIIDLSVAANQPMTTEDNRYTIVFNGEVYNFIEIRQKLETLGISFTTNSDTEVVLKSYQQYGTKCFADFNGMFALGIYDNYKQELIIARDQFGIKPLYYSRNKDFLVFASEMKAIIAHPDIKLGIANQALSEYIWFGNPLGNSTIYEQISELGAGCYMTISLTKTEINSYFEIKNIKEISITENDAVTEIKKLLEASVKRHLISDVPVGVFLSGGIDSSAITALASKHYSGQLKTYSVGFDFSKGPNELGLAAQVAKKYNTDHQEIHINGKNIIDIIEALVIAHDEPFGDAADIPLYLLTRQLKGDIKVVLQGDGGDEFFGGYSRYNTIQNLKKLSSFSFLPKFIEFSKSQNTKILRFQRFISALTEKDFSKRNALLLTMESEFSPPINVFNKDYYDLLKSIDPFKRYNEVYNQLPINIDPVQAFFYTDTQIILKDTFFEKVDKSTMANSMEVRVPFIDKDLAEFMLSIPASLKVKKGETKYLLKKALDGIVPNNILFGKKTGFSVPYAYWLKSSLSDYFIEQISTKKVEAYLCKKEVLRMYLMFKSGKGNFSFLLWKTLIFAVWINKRG